MGKGLPEPPPGKKWIFRRWVHDPRTGKRIYPRSGKCLALLVDA